MYNKGKIITLLFAIFYLYLTVIPVFASDYPTLSADNEGIQNNFHFHLIESKDVVRAAITSFDVTPEGQVVIGLENYTLLIMDSYGTITQSIKFDTVGSYYVRWNGDTLLLYLVRGNCVVEITQDGIMLSGNDLGNVYSWMSFKQNRISLENGDTYIADNKNVALSFLSCERYARLTKSDSNNNTIVLYDVSEAFLARIIAWLLIVGSLIIGVVASIFFALYHYKHQH